MLNPRSVLPMLLLCSVFALFQGCAASDRRTVGAQIDDNTLVVKAGNAIEKNKELDTQANINVFVYNGIVLLTGQAPRQDMIDTAGELIRPLQGVRDVQNQIRVGSPIAFTTKSRDSWITTRVKAMLLGDKEVSAQNIRVVTENGEVFLLGIVQEAEGEKAVEIARNVNGVARVIKVFEFKYD